MCRDRYIVTERRHVIQLNNAVLVLMYEGLGWVGNRRLEERGRGGGGGGGWGWVGS